jgi:hypothetical protein
MGGLTEIFGVDEQTVHVENACSNGWESVRRVVRHYDEVLMQHRAGNDNIEQNKSRIGTREVLTPYSVASFDPS